VEQGACDDREKPGWVKDIQREKRIKPHKSSLRSSVSVDVAMKANTY